MNSSTTTSLWMESQVEQVAAHLCNDPTFIENMTKQQQQLQDPSHIKRLATRVNAEIKIQNLLNLQEEQTSAFTPVFIADLKPDHISQAAIRTLHRVSKVKDLSGSIRLDHE